MLWQLARAYESSIKALSRLYQGSIKALSRLVTGAVAAGARELRLIYSIKALLTLFRCCGDWRERKALLILYEGSIKAQLRPVKALSSLY